jgi:primosomal protein N' (replication factor Y)
VIASFENKEIDILVGTQMVTKGLDFDSVSLVGIMNADQLLFFPGYKSYEKAFQLLTQVSGRAGRRSKQGKVVIQTSSPDHPIIKLVTAHNFQGMYEYEMHTRRQFNYPPFARMVQINLKCKDQLIADKAALFLSNEIRKANIGQVLGPTIPFISKIRNYYLRDVLVKTNATTIDLHLFKQSIRDAITKLKTTKDLKSVIVNVDVDP